MPSTQSFPVMRAAPCRRRRGAGRVRGREREGAGERQDRDGEETRPGLATVMVTHHLEELPPTTSHALLLRDGRVSVAGPAAEVLTGARLTECFGRPIEVHHHTGRRHARSPRP